MFDRETLAKFRAMTPRQAYETAKDAVYRLGAVSSTDFHEVWEELVAHGILTWSQIEEFDGRRGD